MNTLLAIGLCVVGAFEVSVSPDQPLPYSYTDDPLIVEVRSDLPCVVQIRLTATPAYDQSPVEAQFDSVSLGPGTSRWCALKDLATLRGPWSVSVSITEGDQTEAIEATAYRIDRPSDPFSHPIYAYGDLVDRNGLLALRSVAVDTVSVPISHPDINQLLDTVAALDMKVLIRVLPDEIEKARDLEERHCTVLSGWVLPLAGSHAGVVAALEALRGLPCQKPVRIAVPDDARLASGLELLGQGQHLIVPGDLEQLDTLRESLESHGLSDISLNVNVPREAAGAPAQFLPLLFTYLAAGAHMIAFPVDLVYGETGLQPGLSHINGLMHRVTLGEYAGRIRQPGSTRAQIFAAGDHWLIAAWRDDETSTVELPWANAHPFSLMDPWGNSLESTGGDKVWTHPLSDDFLYIMGLGGPVLKKALSGRATAEVKRILEDSALKPTLSESLLKTLKLIEADPADVSSRVQFFALLRAFPEIEERWHAGQLPRPVATVVLTRLAVLSRTLCQLEGALGASFLEPLQDTLARCEEFQSAYLTGATTTAQARARGDWLVAEVRRLMDEAETLVQVDRRIEADAVAALAEWRARALEFAAKAGPLSDQLELPEEPVVEEVPVEPVVEKKKQGKKK